MKSQIKTIIVAAWLLLAPNQMLAWQEQDVSDEQSAASAESGANANGTDDAKDGATAKPGQGSGIKPSTPQDEASPEYLDGAFLLGPAYGEVLVSTRPGKTGQPTRIDYLQLSEEQVAEVKTLSEDMRRQMEDLVEAMRNTVIDRGGIELAAADQEKAQRWQQQQNREAIALKIKIGRAFMELLSEPQRSEMFRQSILQGGTFALLEPFLREKFGLTEAQVASLHKIRDENWRKLSVHFLHVSALHSKDAEPLLAKAYEQLTDEQKAQYQQFIATSFVEGKAGEADQPADAKQPATTGMSGAAFGSTGQGGGFFPTGGFGGSAFGGGVPFENARQVSSNGLMITWSENNDELRGFSNSKGDWEVLKIEKQDRIIPVVTDEVAAVRIGDSMAAFSAVKAQWDVIKLSEGSTAVPVVFDGYTKVEDNGNLYTFAAAKGQWTSPTDPEFTRASMELELKNGNLASLRNQFDEWLKSLPRYKGRAVRVMFSENKKNAVARIETDRKSFLKEVEAKLNELSASSATDDAVSFTESNTGDVSVLETQVARLREELDNLELAVRANAGTTFSPGQKKEDHRRELRKLVEKSFDLRQQMQRLEAQRMKLKLQLIETNLDTREKAREAIVERRLTDLLESKDQPSNPLQSQHNPGDPEILFFTASYCSPCQQMQPIVDRLKADNLAIKQIDITSEPELTRRYKIDRIPTFVVMADGKEIERVIGITSENALRESLSDATKNRGKNQAGKTWRSIVRGEAISVPPSAENGTDDDAIPGTPIALPGPAHVPLGDPARLDARSMRPSDSDSRIQWPQPAEIVKELRMCRSLVVAYQSQLQVPEDRVKQWSQSLETLKSQGHLTDEATEEHREKYLAQDKLALMSLQDTLKKTQHDWSYAWSAYQSKLRLLKLDAEEAELAVDLKSSGLDRMQQLAAAQAVSTEEVRNAESEAVTAKYNLARAKELLKLYVDIETQEPELNPDSLKE